MKKFSSLKSIPAYLPIVNIDTEMIIPKQFLKTIKRTGLGKHLFNEIRFNADGSENEDFVLNKPAYREASILVAGDNFGCGSSRSIFFGCVRTYGEERGVCGDLSAQAPLLRRLACAHRLLS